MCVKCVFRLDTSGACMWYGSSTENFLGLLVFKKKRHRAYLRDYIMSLSEIGQSILSGSNLSTLHFSRFIKEILCLNNPLYSGNP